MQKSSEGPCGRELKRSRLETMFESMRGELKGGGDGPSVDLAVPVAGQVCELGVYRELAHGSRGYRIRHRRHPRPPVVPHVVPPVVPRASEAATARSHEEPDPLFPATNAPEPDAVSPESHTHGGTGGRD